jgi:hypothetical protein
MKFFALLMILTLPISVSANTILECFPRDGKFDVRDVVIGNIVINSKRVILFQEVPVFESVRFDVSKAVQESSRTGSWTTYTDNREMNEEIVTLQIEDSGKTRRGYLTRESSFLSDEPFFSVIALKCIESK